MKPLSERIRDEMGCWPSTSSLSAVLRECVELAQRVEEAPQVIFDSEEDDDEPRLSEWRQDEVVALHGQRVRLVPEPPEVG